MLSYLSIRNFGIFSEVELELRPGLSVFTGETGAGKSMIVDAVMACLGQRTPRDLLRSGEERAELELLATGVTVPADADEAISRFVGPEGEVILQKEILPDRSYLRVNGRLATASAVQELGSRLVDIHGQQEHHSLLRPSNYTGMLDGLRRDSILPLKGEFGQLYRKRQEILRRMDDLGRGGKERQREIDLLSFQVREIEDAKLKSGEESELRQEYTVLSAQERLIELTSQAYGALYESRGHGSTAYDLLDEAVSCLKKCQATDPAASEALESIQQVSFVLEAALDSLRQYRKGLSVEPERLREVSERLDLIQRLKAKYGDSIDDILAYARESKKRLDDLLNADQALEEFRGELEAVEKDMGRVGSRLSALRREVAAEMSASVTSTLRELGMPGATFQASVSAAQEPHVAGFDLVDFLFTANAGEQPMPVHKVASGGELSRLMLAMKSFLEETDPVPTLIFDEIDAGIGGQAGQAVAARLRRLGRTHQVLCVTHLASIAAAADNHFLVSKTEKDGRTYATVRLLSDEERVPEIARMLSGTTDGISLDHARELLKATRDKHSA